MNEGNEIMRRLSIAIIHEEIGSVKTTVGYREGFRAVESAFIQFPFVEVNRCLISSSEGERWAHGRGYLFVAARRNHRDNL